MLPLLTAIILRILANPVANVFQKKLTGRRHNALMVNFLTFFLLAIVCAIPALRYDWAQYSKEFWAYCALGGLCGGVGNAFLVKALHRGELSVLGPINSYKSVIALIIGIFALKEIPNFWGLAGMALIIFGSYFVLDTTPEKFSPALFKNREIRYRMFALAFSAVESIFIKKIIICSDASVAFIVWCFGGAIFAFLILPFFKVDIKAEAAKIKKRDAALFLCLIACIGVMQYTTNYVFAHMDVGYALALFQLSITASIFLGYKIFNETGILKKFAGAAVMIAGSAMIILLN